jgi:hypothetical protein
MPSLYPARSRRSEKPCIDGFCNRATHNLWVLLEEVNWVGQELAAGTYEKRYRSRLDNTIYLPLIEEALHERRKREAQGEITVNRPLL